MNKEIGSLWIIAVMCSICASHSEAGSVERASRFHIVKTVPMDGSANIPLNCTVAFAFNTPLDTTVHYGERGFPVEIKYREDCLKIVSVSLSNDLRTISFEVNHSPAARPRWIITGARAQNGSVFDGIAALEYQTARTPGPDGARNPSRESELLVGFLLGGAVLFLLILLPLGIYYCVKVHMMTKGEKTGRAIRGMILAELYCVILIVGVSLVTVAVLSSWEQHGRPRFKKRWWIFPLGFGLGALALLPLKHLFSWVGVSFDAAADYKSSPTVKYLDQVEEAKKQETNAAFARKLSRIMLIVAGATILILVIASLK